MKNSCEPSRIRLLEGNKPGAGEHRAGCSPGSSCIRCSRHWAEPTTNTKYLRNSNLCATVDTVAAFESCAGKALVKQGGPELVSLSPDFWQCQAVFEGPKPEKWLWYESNRHPPFWPRLARFFGKMQDFMQDNWGPFCRMNTGFSPRRRKTGFAKCKISGQFCVVSFRVSTICIVLVENIVVLRVQIQNKGEPQK